MDFLLSRFDNETLTTINFFESIHRFINVKINLNHSNVTGKIYGYAHDFCNMKVREKQNQFSCIAHNFFCFDMFFVIPTFVLYVLSCIHGFFSYVLTCVCASRTYVFYVPFFCLHNYISFS